MRTRKGKTRGHSSTHVWLMRAVLGGTLVAAALVWLQQGAWFSAARAAVQGGGTRTQSLREPPRLLSEEEAKQGLRERHRAMRQRFLAHEHRRSQEPREDYSIPEPARNAGRHPRPDAPGGEFNRGGWR